MMPVLDPVTFKTVSRRKVRYVTDTAKLQECLSSHADQFIEAKNNRRFPGSDRPSNRDKQIWFLSRALAGAVHGIAARTAINLVGSKTPKAAFADSNSARATRKPAGKK
jgi:hypothetical protein